MKFEKWQLALGFGQFRLEIVAQVPDLRFRINFYAQPLGAAPVMIAFRLRLLGTIKPLRSRERIALSASGRIFAKYAAESGRFSSMRSLSCPFDP